MSANKLVLCNLEMNNILCNLEVHNVLCNLKIHNVQLPRHNKIVTGSMIGAKRSERSKHRVDVKKNTVAPFHLLLDPEGPYVDRLSFMLASFLLRKKNVIYLTSIVYRPCSHHFSSEKQNRLCNLEMCNVQITAYP